MGQKIPSNPGKNGRIVVPVLLLFIFVNLLLLWPATNMPTSPRFPYFDKLAHAGIYFSLQFCASLLFPDRAGRKKRTVAAFFLLLHGCLIEYIQPLTGRSFDSGDMLADAVGIITAWAFAPNIVLSLKKYFFQKE